MYAGYSNAVMDTLQFHFSISIFSNSDYDKFYWNPNLSWKNKYKELGDNFYYNLIEKLDNNLLVFTTDGWHNYQMRMNVSYIMSLVLPFFIIGYNIKEVAIYIYQLEFSVYHLGLFSVMYFVILFGARSLTFNIFYNTILKLKK